MVWNDCCGLAKESQKVKETGMCSKYVNLDERIWRDGHVCRRANESLGVGSLYCQGEFQYPLTSTKFVICLRIF